jgi:hypothetical protein
MYRTRLGAARTEKALLFVIVGWLLGEYYATTEPEKRHHWKTRLIAMAEEMNKEARR